MRYRMWQFGYSTQWRIRGTRGSPMAILSVKTTATTDGFGLILFHFFLGVLSGIGYGFDSLGDRIHSLFPPDSCRKHSGSRRYSRDPECPVQLQPCVFTQQLAGMHGAYAPKTPLSGEMDESGSLQKPLAGLRGEIAIRARRCDICNRFTHAFASQGLPERRGPGPYPARCVRLPCLRFVRGR